MIIQNKEILIKTVSELKKKMENDLKGINQTMLSKNLRDQLSIAQKDFMQNLMHIDSLCKDDKISIDQNFYKEKLDKAYKDFSAVVQRAIIFTQAKNNTISL